MSDNATANKPAAWRVDVEGIGSIMPICRDWVEVQGICNRFGDRVFGVAPLYEEATTTPFTLTDAEREAIQTAMNAYGDNNDDRECEMIEATLWRLLERTK